LPAPEGFPQPGSLERVAAGSALDRLAAQVAASHPRSALGRRHANGRSVLGADIVRAARGGDPAAIGGLETWAEHVGIGVANAINTFDPDEVVLGGGGARAGELLLEPARRVARSYVVPGLGRDTRIRLARHGARAGVLGAGLLALHELQPSISPGAPRRRTSSSTPSLAFASTYGTGRAAQLWFGVRGWVDAMHREAIAVPFGRRVTGRFTSADASRPLRTPSWPPEALPTGPKRARARKHGRGWTESAIL
jgi:hypothetical protein